MNVYAKLAKARVELQSKDIKKTGKNVKFNYMELEDFLPMANVINNEIGLVPVFSILNEVASLTIHNTEGEDSITFTSPVAHAKLQGGASPIQELGAQHTYMRRYLYLLAYEICENDSLDSQETDNTTKDKKPDTKQPDNPTPPKPQYIVDDICTLANALGITDAQIFKSVGIKSRSEMTQAMAAFVHKEIEKKQEKKV